MTGSSWVDRRPEESPLTLPDGEVRERSSVYELLADEGREVALVLRDASVLFARVVGDRRVRPWGRRDSQVVDVAGVARLVVITKMRWAQAQRIAALQRAGLRMVARGRRGEVEAKPTKKRGRRA